MSARRTIVILTGAGISAESGVPTFRGSGGLWEGHRVERGGHAGGLRARPGARASVLQRATAPACRRRSNRNSAHRALADLEAGFEGEFVLVTQNVDDLHERGGSKRVLHMHGQLLLSRCASCGRVETWPRGPGTPRPSAPAADRAGTVRPHIVWFGEMPLHMDEIEEKLRAADLFVRDRNVGAGFTRRRDSWTLARHTGARDDRGERGTHGGE